MATFTMNTKDGEMTFFVPANGGYVTLESGSNHGTLGRQICKGGKFMGSTLRATPETLPEVARLWRRQQLAAAKKF